MPSTATRYSLTGASPAAFALRARILRKEPGVGHGRLRFATAFRTSVERLRLTTGGQCRQLPTESLPNCPGLPTGRNGRRETPQHDRVSRLPASSARAFRNFRPEKVARFVGLEIARASALSEPESRDQAFPHRGLRECAKSSRNEGEVMPTHRPTGFNWADAMEPLEGRRRAHVIASFVAKDGHGDRNRAVGAIESLMRRRPAAVDARMLSRAAGSRR